VILTAYIAAKLIAYTIWAWFGLHRFQSDRPAPAWQPVAIAAARIAVGLLLAFPIYLTSTAVLESLPSGAHRASSVYLVYAVGYGLFRWLAWSAVATMVFAETRGVSAIVLGAHARDRHWRAGGVLTSFLLDVPLLAALGGPMVGKFFC
jgi:hypothetical protein